MGIKNTYQDVMTSGLPGDAFRAGPWRAETHVIRSASGNIYGYAYTHAEGGGASVGGANASFAGILVRPLATAIEGEHKQGSAGELCTFGQIWAGIKTTGSAPVAPAIGGKVYFNTTTGQLQTEGTGGRQIIGASISSATPATAVSGVSLVVVTLNGPYPTPSE